MALRVRSVFSQRPPDPSVASRPFGQTIEVPASMLTHQEAIMFPGYRHTPIFDSDRKRCPVCNQSVYSLAGIHPQCAIKLAEGPPIKGKKQSASKSDSPVALVAPGNDT